MLPDHRRRCLLLGLILWLVLLTPAARSVLEASMTRHMLVQLPLLALAGAGLAWALPAAARQAIDRWNAYGISGLILVSFTATVWMLPLTLDAALDTPFAAAIKFLSVPLGIGAALALSWPRANFIVRAVFLAESMATLFRAGWLYLASPQRLCSNYLLDDQQFLGEALLVIGALALLALSGKLLFGRFRGPIQR